MTGVAGGAILLEVELILILILGRLERGVETAD